MSTIDERVVSMKFDNSQFQKNTADTLNTLQKLKDGLKLEGATKGLEGVSDAAKNLSLQNIADGVDHVASRFSALNVIAYTVIANITSRVLDAGINIAKSFTIQPITDGLSEFATNMTSIQTILANTQSKGTNLDQVNAALQELNTYSDKTIYNFSEMAKNIGTFTSAGVDLNTSVNAIKGIANLAAVSGSTSDQASSAMYQLSQALASGTVKLQDWNSVINSGMGGEVFQNALKDTARTQGVAIDDIIKKNGSFRDSLQDGWLTSDILTKTLAKFTGDLTDEQLKAQGYTDAQIVSIQQLAKTAQDAATKVKTIPQLVGTLQEATGSGWTQTFQIVLGNFNEAQDLFTNISNRLGAMISQSANARNALLQGWKDLGGRTTLIQALTDAFNILMSIIKPIKEAFNEIFPPITAKNLNAITNSFKAFIDSLKPSDKTLVALKTIFLGIFSVLDIGRMILVGFIGMLGKLFGTITSGSGGALQFAATLANWVFHIRNVIKNGQGLTNFFNGLGAVLTVPIELVKSLIKLIASLFDGIQGLDFSGFGDGLDVVKKRFAGLSGVAGNIVTAWEHVKTWFASFLAFIKPVTDKIGQFFAGLGKDIQNGLKGITFNGFLDAVNTGLFVGLLVLFKKFTSGGFLKQLGAGGLVDSITETFEGLTGVLTAMQQQVKAKTLISIAIAVALLTASIVALSFIDSGRLTSSLTGMTVAFGELLTSYAVLEKISSGKGYLKAPLIAASLVILASAMTIMAVAVNIFAQLSWEGLAKGLVGVGVVLGELALFEKFNSVGKAGILQAAGIVVLASALLILANAVQSFGSMDLGTLSQGLVSVGLVLTAIVAFSKTAGSGVNLTLSAAGIFIIAAAMKLLASAVGDFAAFSWDQIIRGLTSMGIALGLLVAAMAVMGGDAATFVGAVSFTIVAAALLVLAQALQEMAKMSWDDIGRVATIMAGALTLITAAMIFMTEGLPGAAAMLVFAPALVIMAEAFKQLATLSWDDIGRIAVIMTGALVEIAAAMIIMTGALPGAFAMVTAAGAMVILGAAMKIMGSLSWDEVGVGLTVMAGALGILAIAGIALLPAIPGLLVLGTTIALIGLGIGAAGIGMIGFAAGLTAISLAGPLATTAIQAMFTTVIGLIPQALTALADGIVQFTGILTDNAPAFLAAGVALIITILTAINTTAPQIISTMLGLIYGLLDTVQQNVGPMADKGAAIIVGFLQGIARNLPAVIQAATDVIVSFINGISNNLPRITDAGADLVVKFVNSVASSINTHKQALQDAGVNLASAIVSGMTGGLSDKVGQVAQGAANLAKSALDAAKKALGIASPSKEFFSVGDFSVQGLANGFTASSTVAEKAAAQVGTNTLESMKASLAGINTAFAQGMDGSPVIRPVVDMSNVTSSASKISGMFNGQTITLDKAYVQASNIATTQSAQATAATDTTSTDTPDTAPVTFNQYNSSPKALSNLEIYRQTNNQISTAKEKLNTNA